MQTMPFTDERLTDVKEQTRKDSSFTEMQRVILEGWPHSKPDCSPEALDYWNIFKGSNILIPKFMRKRILEKIHESHMGFKNAEDEPEK